MPNFRTLIDNGYYLHYPISVAILLIIYVEDNLRMDKHIKFQKEDI